MDVKHLAELSTPLLIGVIGGLVRILMLGSGKSKVQLLRGFCVSVGLGCLVGIVISGMGLDPAIEAAIISMTAILGGDVFEGLLKLSEDWRKDPKSIIKLFRGKE